MRFGECRGFKEQRNKAKKNNKINIKYKFKFRW